METQFQPLYKQVYDVLTERLVSQYWKPSQPLPSEQELARELGVSQGTVRKALNKMVSEKLLERRQGKGTYVAEHTQESSLFRFFNFCDADGEPVYPETTVVSMTRRTPKPIEKEHLSLSSKARILEMVRLRTINNKPAILEKIIQPLAIFPDIDKEPEIPNSLYTLYQSRFDINIIEVKEQLRAELANEEQARLLELEQGDPILVIRRWGVNIDGRVVEWRESYCRTTDINYSATLR